jgi:serine acetyltransferase
MMSMHSLVEAAHAPAPVAVFKHRSVMSVSRKAPSIGEGAFVAPSAAVIGDVTLGKRASVWYGCVLRGALPL